MGGWSGRGAVTALAVVLTAGGCSDGDRYGGSTPYRAPVTSTTKAARQPEATTRTAVVPEELTAAVWGRATKTMEVDLKILPDGRYRSVEIYSPVESGGIYQLRRVEDGVARVSGNRLRLAGSRATVTRTAADDPNGDYERATPARTGTYEWQVTGDELHLVDANGDDAVFTRQEG